MGANLKLLQNDYVTHWCRPLSSCATSIGQCPHSRGNPLTEEVAVGESWSERGPMKEGRLNQRWQEEIMLQETEVQKMQRMSEF